MLQQSIRKEIYNKFSQEKEQYIISEYLSGKNPKQIGKLLNTYNTSIRRVLLRNNIIPLTSAQRWSQRNNVFLNNTEESYYWIGFIIADGCINSTRIEVTSSEKDSNHLLKYSLFINAPIKRVYNKRYDVYETRVGFKDKVISNYLISLGITERKSMTIKLSISLNRHILRGIFDGDGYARKSNGTIEIATGSEELKNQIVKYLDSNNIYCTVHKSTKTLYIIGVYTKKECKKLYDLLYTDATVFLERKKAVLCPFYDENQ